MPLPRSLFLSIVLIMAGLSWVAPRNVQARQDEAFHLIAMEGVVKVRESLGEVFRPAKTGELLGPGAALQTGPGGKAMLFFSQGVVLKLGEVSLVEFGKPALNTSKHHEFAVTLVNGTLHFAVDLSDLHLGAVIYMPTSRVTIPRGTGFLVSAGQDRLICIEGSTISIANQISGRHLSVGPRQVAISEKNGLLKLSQVQSGEMDQLLVRTRVALAMPPIQSLRPPSPAITPITLDDQVRQPWPVLPPVIQSPNLWIHEASGPEGRIGVRPTPRR
jgi:hypothetical protein